MSKRSEAMKIAREWYDSGNENPDDFAEMIKQVIALEEQPTRPHGLAVVDDEGENQAVRMFLALYGGSCGVTAEQMRKHLKMAGFDGAWPEWANNHNGHLTKAGAQLWIRHMFNLEQPAQQNPTELDIWKVRALQAEQVIKKFMTQPEQHKPLPDFSPIFSGIKENT